MTGMLQNGCKTNKSESPVIIRSALPDNASSRYILSFGSRQIVTVWVILTVEALFSSFVKKLNLSSIFKYFWHYRF
jgi:hypothetical protein